MRRVDYSLLLHHIKGTEVERPNKASEGTLSGHAAGEPFDAHYGDLFLAPPTSLYVNWSAGLQIQFHVCDLDQSWDGTREEWARAYLKVFVESAEHRCQYMRKKFITPFVKYL